MRTLTGAIVAVISAVKEMKVMQGENAVTGLDFYA